MAKPSDIDNFFLFALTFTTCSCTWSWFWPLLSKKTFYDTLGRQNLQRWTGFDLLDAYILPLKMWQNSLGPVRAPRHKTNWYPPQRLAIKVQYKEFCHISRGGCPSGPQGPPDTKPVNSFLTYRGGGPGPIILQPWPPWLEAHSCLRRHTWLVAYALLSQIR